MIGNTEEGRGGSAPSLRQLTWFLAIRVLVLVLFLGGSILLRFADGSEMAGSPLPYLYALVGISILQTLGSALWLPRIVLFRRFVQLQVVWDLLFSVSLIYVTGGIGSLFSFLFLLVIISASFFLSRHEIYFVASAAAILYGSLLDLQYYGYLPLLEGLVFPKQVDGQTYFFAVFINVTAFFLTAFLGGTLSERLKRSVQAFEKKAIDYEELGNLNRTILANISSGLMIVNSQGRIRSFNVAASKLTGLSLEEVYDRDVRALFPGFAAFDNGSLQVVKRGEGEFVDPSGRSLLLGYSSTLVRDPDEQPSALLITFQDLTAFKEMQEQLQRSDRLAAVGRLASGMAHEIRNPLASISGSVQLLMETGAVDKAGLRLMGIVVREVDRLNGLLTDFLVYAKPSPPRFEAVDLSALFDELAEMVTVDPRFAAVKIRREYSPGVVVSVDRKQFRQALWDLVINGAEAMPEGGTLTLGVSRDGSRIYVEDTGRGIPEGIKERIFEPFFTTKDFGTGLGLASVLTIVEAHGGRIEAETGRNGGALFTIYLASDETGR
ncbi:sensor histidine kinase PilS, PAS domain-containing [Desulfuromonas soudanensis]|uniref:histidine kinase n=1 Tax=Desulfuromonas soudanensis TaxID=1603606 RepID=A0A0M5IL68_9BACT|nr:ATP-binding protein [Desulfuromonas soudanensis]ALC16924.1 sensor histidine kinase PilS, PAS domain-containing [Desulfuromonas soudanensis]